MALSFICSHFVFTVVSVVLIRDSSRLETYYAESIRDREFVGIFPLHTALIRAQNDYLK